MSSIQYSPVFVLRHSVAVCEAPPVFADRVPSAASQEHSARGHVLHAARYVLGRSSSLFTELGARHARRLVPVPGSLFYEA